MRQALGQRVSIARVDRGAVMRYGRWVLMRPPCSAALMRLLRVRPECPAFLYPGVRAAGYSSQTHGECQTPPVVVLLLDGHHPACFQ